MTLIAKVMKELCPALDKKVLQTRSSSAKKPQVCIMWFFSLGIMQTLTSLITTALQEPKTTITPLLRGFVPLECFTLSIFVLKIVAECKGNCHQHKPLFSSPFPHGLQLGSCWEVGFRFSLALKRCHSYWNNPNPMREDGFFLCLFLPYHLLSIATISQMERSSVCMPTEFMLLLKKQNH